VQCWWFIIRRRRRPALVVHRRFERPHLLPVVFHSLSCSHPTVPRHQLHWLLALRYLPPRELELTEVVQA
jgi:hypothetical protein